MVEPRRKNSKHKVGFCMLTQGFVEVVNRVVGLCSGLTAADTVYDHDTFSKDDKMGDAEFDIFPFIEASKMNLTGLPNGTVVTRIQPSKHNCLADESCITYSNGKVVQDMILRLQNVECGEVEIQLQWIDLPGSKGL
ncbi:protein C2-DOMAIN ABA-RELATED 4-like [Glycine soja]|uniref:protein C2-DOMAIN ABA-RELATED 4-like n=1 Tax=Glycine soja TaxID=3848 RepID=UPI00103FDBAF|nr:protein C2-DOMAIN ABA-RELATED 4-like [Glycine soja]